MYTSLDINTLDIWVIKDELTTPSDNEIMVYDLTDPEVEVASMATS